MSREDLETLLGDIGITVAKDRPNFVLRNIVTALIQQGRLLSEISLNEYVDLYTLPYP